MRLETNRLVLRDWDLKKAGDHNRDRQPQKLFLQII